jgi:hypothetical protein
MDKAGECFCAVGEEEETLTSLAKTTRSAAFKSLQLLEFVSYRRNLNTAPQRKVVIFQ